MALVITIAGVDRTSVVGEDSIVITQLADSFTFTATLTLFDAGSNISITAGSHLVADEITIVDGATTFFGGYVANQDIETAEGGSRLITLECQGYGILLNETLMGEENYTNTADASIIDDLFDTYLPAIDSTTHVATIDATMTISLPIATLAEGMDTICQRTGGRWYVDNEKKLHYFADEGNDAGFKLSDEPDGETSFSYLDTVEKLEDASGIINRVRVIGADNFASVRNDAASQAAYGVRAIIVTDTSLTTQVQREERGDAVLDKHAAPQVTFVVRTSHGGAVVGNEIDFKCDDLGYNSISDGDDALVIRELGITWEQSEPVYEMCLGEAETRAIHRATHTANKLQAIVIDPAIPLASRGWSHSMEFSATDSNTVAWAGGTITLAGGAGSFSIDAGNTGDIPPNFITYVYLDADVSLTVLQTTTSAADSVGAHKILIAAAAPVGDGDKKCEFQVFGSHGTGSFLTTDNLAAGCVTANLVAANQIITSAANIASAVITNAHITDVYANRIQADKIRIGESIFDKTDGLLLLNSPWKILQEGSGAETANILYGKRGERIRLGEDAADPDSRGALHMVPGRWPGTQALIIEEATTNECDNPSVETNLTGWSNWGAAPTHERSTDWAYRGDYSVHSVAAENSDGPAAPPYTVTDTVTYTFSIKIKVISGTYKAAVIKNADPWTTYVQQLSLGPGFHDVALTWTATATEAVRIIVVSIAGTGEVYVDAVQYEAKAYPTTNADGSLGDGYEWTSTPHASASERIATYGLLDDLVGLISGNNTLSFRCVVQAPYDYDATWPAAIFNTIFDTRGADDNNRVILFYDQRAGQDRLEVYINGGYRLEATGVTFSAGDWLDIVVTLDFTNDVYKIYVNGELIDSDTTALTAPTLTDWVLGDFYNAPGTQIGGWAFAEYAVFDRVLTAVEVAQLYNLQRPLIDTGATEKPGIYIIDGQFRIQSKQTGNRIEITPEHIAGYDNAGTKQFYLRASDGKAMCGGGKVILDDNGITFDNTTLDCWFKNDAFNDIVIGSDPGAAGFIVYEDADGWKGLFDVQWKAGNLISFRLGPTGGATKALYIATCPLQISTGAPDDITILPGSDRLFIDTTYIEYGELGADPAAPNADRGRLYIKDNGAGKTQLCIRFNTGAVQVIATQP